MGKPSSQWFVVMYHSNKYHAVVFDSSKQARKFAKGKGLPYKGFLTKEEAIAYVGCRESKIHFQLEAPVMPSRICLLCEKPFKGKTKLCPSCNKLRKEAPHSMNVGTAVSIKTLYPDKDVFSIIKDTPNLVTQTIRSTSSKDRAALRKSRSAQLKSEDYLQSYYAKDTNNIPDFIKRLIATDKTKSLIYLEGERANPKIYYLCRRCGQEQCQSYENLKAGQGHNCLSLKSSGEVMVEEFLKGIGIAYHTQYNTLKCLNPKTKKTMPYDFELPKHNVIIEVQGNQHLEYLPYFHGSIENFEYQLWKDRYKKSFAEQHGYTVIYVNYEDLNSERYKSIILEALHC